MTKQWTAIKGQDVVLPDLAALDREQLESMLADAYQINECYRVLKKGGSNIVAEVLRGNDFYEYDHYPDGDVYDDETCSQYYYHAHRGLPGENGHFHTFVRRAGIPKGISPVPYDGETPWPTGDDVLCHFVAVSMDVYGFPIGLFATNRWVTDENWYRADDLEQVLDGFEIDHAVPSWPTNLWLSSMLRLFRPQVSALLRHRDQIVDAWAKAHPDKDVYEDRDLEVTGWLRISVDQQMSQVRELLA